MVDRDSPIRTVAVVDTIAACSTAGVSIRRCASTNFPAAPPFVSMIPARTRSSITDRFASSVSRAVNPCGSSD